jgi:SnoaL-like domain
VRPHLPDGKSETREGFRLIPACALLCSRSSGGVEGEALCVAYVQARHYLPNDKGDDTQTIFGYYTNHLVRTAQGWRIQSCKLTLTWQTGNWHIFTLANERLKGSETKPA